jgi:hypothetical protein
MEGWCSFKGLFLQRRGSSLLAQGMWEVVSNDKLGWIRQTAVPGHIGRIATLSVAELRGRTHERTNIESNTHTPLWKQTSLSPIE